MFSVAAIAANCVFVARDGWVLRRVERIMRRVRAFSDSLSSGRRSVRLSEGRGSFARAAGQIGR